MILKDHNTVFVHVPKTAGQSMENSFLQHLGKSRADGAEFLLGKNEDPSLGPERLAHLTASQYVNCGHLTADQYADCFSFGFVRNPWDRAVSFYRFSGMASLISFKTFASDYLPLLIEQRNWFYKPQVEFLYNDKDQEGVSFIGRFENLETDWNHCCEQIGLVGLPLSKDNQTIPSGLLSPKSLKWLLSYPRIFTQLSLKSTKHQHYRGYYDQDTQDIVGKLYQRDCQLLDYKF